MKQIINGKSYNTETATLITSWDNDLGHNDFGWCEEDLYRTAKGAWFVHGQGGSLSVWSRSVGDNGRCGGESLQALTEAEVLEWAEQRRISPEKLAPYITIEEA